LRKSEGNDGRSGGKRRERGDTSLLNWSMLARIGTMMWTRKKYME
jgi:hypothetical protein